MMMMNKRKQSDVCSGSSSDHSVVYNPETVFNLNANSACGSAGKIPRFNLNLDSELQLNYAPFNDFFVSKPAKVSEKDLNAAKSACGSGGQIPRFNLNLDGRAQFNLFDDFQLNYAPFNDFFLSKPANVSEEDSTEVCLDLRLSLAPPCHKTVLSDDASSVCSEKSSIYSTVSETETALDVMPLNVYFPDDVNVAVAVKWTIKKVLTKSDCDDQHRLLISRADAEEHILQYLDESSREQFESKNELKVDVYDYDTRSWVELKLNRRPSNGSIVLTDNWKRDFVVRRGLKVGDEIGLRWDDNTLFFSVLHRAPCRPKLEQ